MGLELELASGSELWWRFSGSHRILQLTGTREPRKKLLQIIENDRVWWIQQALPNPPETVGRRRNQLSEAAKESLGVLAFKLWRDPQGWGNRDSTVRETMIA